MRVIDAVIGRERADALEEQAIELEHRAVRLADGERVVLRITCEQGDPDDLLDDLREGLRGACESWEHYTVYEPLAVEPRPSDDGEENGSDDESVAGTDEIERFVDGGTRVSRAFVGLSLLAGVLAAAGLLRESAAVVVGSMVLAPLFKPLAVMGVGVVIGRPGRALRGAVGVGVSLALSSSAALLVALLTPDRSATALLMLRTGISPFDPVVAISAGLAMAFIIVRRDSMAMVGIVVAASLMPVAAAFGIAVALWRFDLIGGAAFTMLSNVGGITLGLILGLRFDRLRATDSRREALAHWVVKRSVAAGTVLMLALLGFSGWAYLTGRKEVELRERVPLLPGGAQPAAAWRTEDGTWILVASPGGATGGALSEDSLLIVDGRVVSPEDRPDSE
ncbi:MAG: TIGR00341 family protein [Planctomycetota bacterium]